MRERRIFGPPGTGKTTFLATIAIPDAVEKYGPDEVMVTSFTRTGAKEIASKPSMRTQKRIQVNDQNVGTLHSIIYRALSNPPLMEVNFVEKWNETHPAYQISGKSKTSMDETPDEEGSADKEGDALLNQMNINRHLMIPQSEWDPIVSFFAKEWEEYRMSVMAFDFTGLIEHALKDMPYAPNQPRIIFVDEAQDFTKLELAVVRSWAINLDELILVGDDDQCIYTFAGASPDAFLNPPIPDENKQVLGQSYRVPQAILERSTELINRVAYREPKEYKPRTELFSDEVSQGVVREAEGVNYKTPDRIVEMVKEYLSKDMSVMLLASCSYMLLPIRRELYDSGLPFHNPYRRRRGDWNPLKISDNPNAATSILLSYITPNEDGYWSIPQFIRFARHLKVGELGLIRKQGKAAIKTLEELCDEGVEGLESCDGCIDQVLSPQAIKTALSQDLHWLEENLLAAKSKALKYPLRVLRKSGVEAITKEPRITIGTIHSVKGGEADAVILFPDISFKAHQTMDTQKGHDALIRLFYVGMTRAKEELILCAPAAGKYTFSGPRFYVNL